MKKIFTTLFVIVIVFASGMSYAQRADSDVRLSEIQVAMIEHMNLIDRPDLANKLRDLDLASWQVIFDSVPTKLKYVNAVESMRKNKESSGDQQDSLSSDFQSLSPIINSPLNIMAPLFSPAYPTGTDYNSYTATLPGLQLLFDTPDIGTETGTSLVDERCDGNGEGGLRIATHVLEYVTIAADATCAGVGTFACIPYGVAAAASYASEIVLQQCGYQTALVDSAEIEAAFENTVGIIGTVNDIDTIVSDETNFTSDAELAVLQNQLSVHDADIKSDLNVHDIKINNNLDIHDADIKSQLQTHDTDVKALLVVLQGGVDLLLARQLEVIRLLHTPQGRRSTNVPACNGLDCDWPNKN